MAVEVFDQKYYVLQASAVDPDFAVNVAHSMMYQVAGTSPNRVFLQHHTQFLLAGGPVVPTIVPKTKMITVNGPGASRVGPHVLSTKLWQICGGDSLNRGELHVPHTSAFAITS